MRVPNCIARAGPLKVVSPVLSVLGEKKFPPEFSQLEKSVSVNIFSRDFFYTNSTHGGKLENQLYLVL